MELILVYVTHSNEEEAKKISDHLIKYKMIACANIFPITSVYIWEGQAVSDGEFVSILKTRKENWTIVKEEVEKMHPYELPCIIKINIKANKKYKEWIYEMTQPPDQ